MRHSTFLFAVHQLCEGERPPGMTGSHLMRHRYAPIRRLLSEDAHIPCRPAAWKELVPCNPPTPHDPLTPHAPDRARRIPTAISSPGWERTAWTAMPSRC